MHALQRFSFLQIEVFNILFVKEVQSKYRVHCVACARRANFEDFITVQQYSWEDLAIVFDQFQFMPVSGF